MEVVGGLGGGGRTGGKWDICNSINNRKKENKIEKEVKNTDWKNKTTRLKLVDKSTGPKLLTVAQ